jgi:hypothetical protein
MPSFLPTLGLDVFDETPKPTRVELPPRLPAGCGYQLVVTSRAREDGCVRIVRDGRELVRVMPDGVVVLYHDAVLPAPES